MLTQCPSCQTTFRVTTEILRVADGQVRCGRCQTQFDALERLIDENEPAQPESRYPRPARTLPPPSPIEVEEAAAQEDITLEGRHIEISGRYRVPDAGRGEPQIREETVEEWVEIDDIDAAADEEAAVIDVADEFEEDADAQDELDAKELDADRLDVDARGGIEVVEDDAAAFRESRAVMASPLSERLRAAGASDFDLLERRPVRPAVAPLWKILAGPLVLLMLIQIVHSNRHALARHPQLGPAVIGVYDALGARLQPDWDLHAYEILQWHLGSDPSLPGTLKVRANLKNVASFAQPYPLLKLVLEDRWGERVREREFEPSEYLDPSTAPDRLLAPAQQATATISIVDPGPDAEGFRFDVCLRGAKGVVCAADVPRRK
jgi:predicted Zn finger-like uncharacterized protein